MKDKIKNIIELLNSLIGDDEEENGEDKNTPDNEKDESEDDSENGAQVTDMSDTFNQDPFSKKTKEKSKKDKISMMSSMLASKMKGGGLGK